MSDFHCCQSNTLIQYLYFYLSIISEYFFPTLDFMFQSIKRFLYDKSGHGQLGTKLSELLKWRIKSDI